MGYEPAIKAENILLAVITTTQTFDNSNTHTHIFNHTYIHKCMYINIHICVYVYIYIHSSLRLNCHKRALTIFLYQLIDVRLVRLAGRWGGSFAIFQIVGIVVGHVTFGKKISNDVIKKKKKNR